MPRALAQIRYCREHWVNTDKGQRPDQLPSGASVRLPTQWFLWASRLTQHQVLRHIPYPQMRSVIPLIFQFRRNKAVRAYHEQTLMTPKHLAPQLPPVPGHNLGFEATPTLTPLQVLSTHPHHKLSFHCTLIICLLLRHPQEVVVIDNATFRSVSRLGEGCYAKLLVYGELTRSSRHNYVCRRSSRN